MSHTQGSGASSSGNQPTTATRGGASAYPTPANNTGGGSGWGDSGFLKGGTEGASNRLSTSSSSDESTGSKLSGLSGKMSSLTDQKAAGKESHRHDVEEAGGVPSDAYSSASASFMKHKPGGSGTLPGGADAKGAFNSLTGNE